MANYVVYHLHSDLSNGVTNIDSITKYEQYVDYASELGMKAIAFSEHGNIFQWYKKKMYIEKKGMKYIHAEEFYVTDYLESETYKHCVLVALNKDGFHELNRLSSIAFNKKDGHKYYRPRITIDELLNTSNNIVVITACVGGILADKQCGMYDKFLRFLIDNKHRCFLEIQHHNVQKQKDYNLHLFQLHKKYNIPLIAGTDTHCLNESHVRGRDILQKSKNIKFGEEDGWDLTFKTYDELLNSYSEQNVLPIEVVKEAIENTNRLADMVLEFELDKSYKYPSLWKNPKELFLRKINQGIKNRGIDKYENYNEYVSRVKHELKAYEHNGAIDFMLLMEDLISWCRKRNIPIGYGRGSVNGSIIAYLLGITEMDSIKSNLNFDRFMNVERVSLSDIDTDFAPSRIEEIKQYLLNRQGLHCCEIVTFNTIALKGAIRDVGRALDISLTTINDICNNIETNESFFREKYKELFEYVDIVKGTIVSVGTHPCGFIVAPHNVIDEFGVFTTSTSEYFISQINMKELDDLNYVKLDLLKLDTIELIAKTCEIANIPMLTPSNIDINDMGVWKSIREDTTEIFQWSGATGDEYIKKLFSDETLTKLREVQPDVDMMTLFSIGNSAIRPAGASYREDLAVGKIPKSGSDVIDEFLKPTFGYLVFQCQIIEFLHLYCGFTMGEADVVRRHFTKKTGTENDIPIIKDGGIINQKTQHQIPGFIKTMKDKYNMDKDEAEKTIVNFLKVIEDASNYLFSLNHSQPYSYLGYASAWLRFYHPVAFFTAALEINKDNKEKTARDMEYISKIGIKVSPIKFRYSKASYSCDIKNNTIYKGVKSIKFLNEEVGDGLYYMSINKTYEDFIDVLIDISKQNFKINTRQMEILIKLDYFSEFGKSKRLLEIYRLFEKYHNSTKISKSNSIISESILSIYCDRETEKSFFFVQTIEMLKYILSEIPNKNIDIFEKLNAEKEYLGYISYVNKKLLNYVYVMEVNTKYMPTITGYNLWNGETQTYKIYLKDFKCNPIEQCDIIHIFNTTKKNKMKIVGKDENGKNIFEPTNEFWTYILNFQKATKPN